MFLKLGNKGFSIMEVMVMGVIMSVVLFASSQATIIFVRQMISAEKTQEAANEAMDLTMYVRRSSKNLTMSRIQKPTTYLQVPGGDPVGLGLNEAPPLPALTINPADWQQGGGTNPLAGDVQAAVSGTSYDIFLDSFTLEEHSLKGAGENLEKSTKRLLVSRCDTIDKNFSMSTITGKPAVSALYVLAAMKRRPFLSYDQNGFPLVKCCPPENPRCANGALKDHFFKSYVINFNDAHQVVSVEEFPKSNSDNPTLGGGFGLYFMNPEGTNVSIQTFSIVNRCKTMGGNPPPICSKRSDLKAFLSSTVANPSLIKLDTRSISTTLSFDIVKTGVISL